MKRLSLLLLLAALTLTVMAKGKYISYVETSGVWVYIYDEDGHRSKTLSKSNVGEVKGWAKTFFVSKNGVWIYLYDAQGKRYKTLSASNVGEVIGVSGDTFTSRNGVWIYTYDRNGKRIHTRSAH